MYLLNVVATMNQQQVNAKPGNSWVIHPAAAHHC